MRQLGAIRVQLSAVVLALAAAAPRAQTLVSRPALQHVEVVDRSRVVSVARGTTDVLWADIMPKPRIHVYAPGAAGFEAMTLIVSPRRGLAFGKVRYPAGELAASPGLPGIDAAVPVYEKTFRVTLPVTIQKTLKSGDAVMVSGALKYQACDDRICFPSESVPIAWTVNVR